MHFKKIKKNERAFVGFRDASLSPWCVPLHKGKFRAFDDCGAAVYYSFENVNVFFVVYPRDKRLHLAGGSACADVYYRQEVSAAVSFVVSHGIYKRKHN